MADFSELGNMFFDLGGATELVYSLLTLPSIGLPVSTEDRTNVTLTALAKFGLLRGIPVAATKLETKADVQIGSQIMLRAEGKGNDMITDNATPMPREWTLEGYLTDKLWTPGIPTPTYILTKPAVFPMAHKMALQTVMRFIKAYFEWLRSSRAPFYFTTPDAEVIPVLMKNFTMVDVPEVQNTTQVKFTFTEYISLAVTADATKVGNQVQDGGPFGTGVTVGSFVSDLLISNAGATASLLGVI